MFIFTLSADIRIQLQQTARRRTHKRGTCNIPRERALFKPEKSRTRTLRRKQLRDVRRCTGRPRANLWLPCPFPSIPNIPGTRETRPRKKAQKSTRFFSPVCKTNVSCFQRSAFGGFRVSNVTFQHLPDPFRGFFLRTTSSGGKPSELFTGPGGT